MSPLDYGGAWQFVVLFILLILSAFFSASETALMSLGKMRVRHLLESGVKGARRVESLLKAPAKLLGAILVGNNAVNIAASALSTALAIKYFGDSGIGIATVGVTLLVLVFGEITPKTLAAQNAEPVALRVAAPLRFIVLLLSPIVAALGFVTDRFVALLGGDPRADKALITEEELKTIVNVSHEEGVLETEEREMIHNVVDFGDARIKEVMTPRVEMVALDVSAGYEETERLFMAQQYSRIPVYDGSPDTIVGILHFKDFIFKSRELETFSLRRIVRKPFLTYAHKNASDLLREMRDAKEQMAVIVDEYGGTAGIVTLEDLVEEIVGTIEDEYDEKVDAIVETGPGEYLVMGSVSIDDFRRSTGIGISAEHSDSLGGFIVESLGSMAEPGKKVVAEGAEFTVETVSKNRVQRIRVAKV